MTVNWPYTFEFCFHCESKIQLKNAMEVLHKHFSHFLAFLMAEQPGYPREDLINFSKFFEQKIQVWSPHEVKPVYFSSNNVQKNSVVGMELWTF
jgi:hypothetical protein